MGNKYKKKLKRTKKRTKRRTKNRIRKTHRTLRNKKKKTKRISTMKNKKKKNNRKQVGGAVCGDIITYKNSTICHKPKIFVESMTAIDLMNPMGPLRVYMNEDILYEVLNKNNFFRIINTDEDYEHVDISSILISKMEYIQCGDHYSLLFTEYDTNHLNLIELGNIRLKADLYKKKDSKKYSKEWTEYRFQGSLPSDFNFIHWDKMKEPIEITPVVEDKIVKITQLRNNEEFRDKKDLTIGYWNRFKSSGNYEQDKENAYQYSGVGYLAMDIVSLGPVAIASVIGDNTIVRCKDACTISDCVVYIEPKQNITLQDIIIESQMILQEIRVYSISGKLRMAGAMLFSSDYKDVQEIEYNCLYFANTLFKFVTDKIATTLDPKL